MMSYPHMSIEPSRVKPGQISMFMYMCLEYLLDERLCELFVEKARLVMFCRMDKLVESHLCVSDNGDKYKLSDMIHSGIIRLLLPRGCPTFFGQPHR